MNIKGVEKMGGPVKGPDLTLYVLVKKVNLLTGTGLRCLLADNNHGSPDFKPLVYNLTEM